MQPLYGIFPARRQWPPALDDVAKAPSDTTALRLVSGARNLERLPTLERLDALWCFHIGDAQLRAISACTSLRCLYMEDLKTEAFGGLGGLPQLEVLGVENCSKATSLAPFAELKSLRGLAITHFKNVHDLQPLVALTSLRALAVAGSMWTRMRVASFAPLAGLRELELLHLTNIKAEDESLRPLGGLHSLKQLDIANFYPMGEFAWLSLRLKHTKCTWFQPYAAMPHAACRKCGQATMVILTGKGKPALCTACDLDRLQRHAAAWDGRSD